MGFLTVKKTEICFKTQAVEMKRVNFIVKTDNWHHAYKVWKHSHFEHMLQMSFNPTDIF
jgi:DTW domain-containing protein YfiP